MVEFALSQDARWQTVERVIQSPAFRKAPRLSQLLNYLAEHTLLDERDRLTESAIAAHVFGRTDGFDPTIDTIVRSHMMRLRQKLEQCTEADQMSEGIRIVIPKGEYLVRFEQGIQIPNGHLPDGSQETERGQTQKNSTPALIQPQVEESNPTVEQETQIARLRRSFFRLALALVVVSTIALVSVGALIVNLHSRRDFGDEMRSGSNTLWNVMFRPNQKTLYIAPDSGLVLFHKITQSSSMSLSEYLQRDFRNEMRDLPRDKVADALEIANRRYTSVVDIASAAHFSTLAAHHRSTLVPKFARDLRMDDFKQGNVILCGARYSNPWHEVFEPELNFVGSMDTAGHTYTFVNKHPIQGEPAFYRVPWIGSEMLGYIAFVPGMNGKGNVLIIEGSSAGGGEAADDFLFNDAQLQAFLVRIMRKDGSLPYFELLLKANSVDGNAGPLQILAYRTHS
ncbi:MAG TPA: hypothetical protein VM554_02550 [Acidisarcina sp.]|nr:hypothetical protein [Acidisarcina sp.]